MLTRRHPSDISDSRLIAVLGKYVPPIIARSIVERARREAASGPEASWTDPNGLLDRISVGVRLFAAPDQQAAILRDLTDFAVADHESLRQGKAADEPPPASVLRRADEPQTRRDPPMTAPAASAAASAPTASAGAPPAAPPVPPPPSTAGAPAPPSATPSSAHQTVTSYSSTSAASRRDVMPPPKDPAYPTVRAPADAAPISRGGYPPSGTRPLPGPFQRPTMAPPAPSGAHGTPPAGVPKAGALAPERPESSRESREITIVLMTEHDIPRARQVAREICEALGTRALTQQRLVTIVSELGRNMVLYAGGGKITLRPPINSARRVLVMAVDQGPGITNLSEILAGKYKSRSGLGLGIVGTKRLADSFHIETGRHGTTISVEVIV